MTFVDLMNAIKGRWKLASSIVLFFVVVAALLSFLLPKSFTATASVVVDVKPDPITGAISAANSSVMSTQTDIIMNERVARKVIRRLKLDQSPQVIENWRDDTGGQGSVETWLKDLITRKLSVKPGKESNVLSISYSAADPNFASTVTNAFVDAYIETAVELRVQPARQYSAFFDRQAQEARAALEAAQGKLSEFKKANGIVGDDERLDVETARLNDLNAQVVSLQAIAAESNNRNSLANSSSDKVSEALANPVVASLKVELGRAEASLQELNTRLGANHPQVVQARAQIAELKAKVDAETKRVIGSLGVNANINQARVAEAKSALESQRQKVLKLKGARDSIAVLQRDVDGAQKTYDAILARQAQSSLESQSQQANVSLLSYASPPISASFPKPALNIVVALLLSSLIAATVVAGLEVVDKRMRRSDEVMELLGVPVISVVPRAQQDASLHRVDVGRKMLALQGKQG